MTLEEFGFNSWFADQFEPDPKFTVARVTAVHKGECDVSDGTETRSAKTTGRLRHNAKSKLDYPTVGDWVLVKGFNDEDFGRMHVLLERQTALKRKSAGRTNTYQLIAANIDTAFIMQTLGLGFNIRRLERYLVMVNESGIKPIILLSKSDLLTPDELTAKLAEITERMPNVDIYPFSNTEHTRLDEVMALFEPAKTYCIIGTSGVGKTTLLNNLIGEEDYLFTLPVREKDGKGIHSTTWRELITLENGAHVIDTPGMREMGNMDVNDGICETFDDITAMGVNCQFKDCSHVRTKGCAVIEAVENGELAQSRYDNFVQLMTEAAEHEQSQISKRYQDRKLSRFHRSLKK
jgi:ribosome biogenesis GTPase